MNALKKTQEDLQKGRQKLDDMLQRLEREQVRTFSMSVGYKIKAAAHLWDIHLKTFLYSCLNT